MLELLNTPATPLADALPRLEEAVSSLVGIVREAPRLMVAADEPRLHAFACNLASSVGTTGSRTVEFAGSAHIDSDRARAASIGEALERYSATFLPTTAPPASADELGAAVVIPESFALFHERQFMADFPFSAFERSTRLSFVEGFSLQDGRSVLLPGQLVYLAPPHYKEPRIGYPTSNGLACGPTLAEAILSGLLELVERDAMMIVWSNRLSLPLLTTHGDERLESLEKQVFAGTGLRYAAVETSVFFGIPATIGVVRGVAGERAALAVGAGCSVSIVDAWRTCLAEAFGVHRWLRSIFQADPERRVGHPADVKDLEDHMLFYDGADRAAEAAFLDGSSARRCSLDVPELHGSTPGALISQIVHRLADRGVSAFAVDVTSPDVEELGFKVARVIAPELCALDVLGVAPYRGGDRLYKAAFEVGLLEASLGFDDLNPLPHPYP